MISERTIKFTDNTGGYLGEGGYGNFPGFFFNFVMNKERTGGEATNTMSCRETLFNYTNDKTRHIGYCWTSLDIEKMNEFIDAIELALGHKDNPIALYRTQLAKVVIIYVPPFWRNDPTRRSLFSLFIRCAAAYYKINSANQTFDTALRSYSYCSSIRPAIDWFLEGNTVPTYKDGVGGGVVSKFWNMNASQVKTMLRKPKKKKAEKETK